ncbi:MAG: DNA polymerase III subunit delta [Candidatus Dormibacteria bacterium]
MILPLAPVAPQGLTLIHGGERRLVEAEVARWLVAARAAAGDLDVEILDAPARVDRVRSSLSEVPLFDPQRFLLVRDPPQLAERGRRGADGPDALVEALEMRAPTTAVCLVAHADVAAANVVLEAVHRLGGRVIHRPKLKGRELREWLEARVTERGLRLPPAALEHLLSLDGADAGSLETEIDKLVAFAGSGAVTLVDVRRLAAGDPAVAVWSVVEKLTSNNPGGAAQALDRLLEDGVAGQYLLATLAGQLRDLLLAQEVLREHGGGGSVLTREMHLPSWRADRLARQARAVSPKLVERWLRDLQRLEVAVKAGEASEVDGLRILGLRAAAQAARATSARRPARAG